MTDFQDEQKNEIEALESIYPSELQILATSPYHSFTIHIKGNTTDRPEDEARNINCHIQKFKETDGNSWFLYQLIEEALTLSAINKQQLCLAFQVEENLGMAMIFTLVSAASEWLDQHGDDVKLRQEEAKQKQKEKDEEAERVKFEGTRVTVECFLAWKDKFDAEIAEMRSREKVDTNIRKLTGRELFEKDKNLIDSDLQFMQEGEEDVKVDESLFQELEDLDLDELGDVDEDDIKA
ncbi:rwd domain-containing protein, putative [Ixodes scapularis]|uniref:Rwd domain-containing protein, putative n=1 Tax=Ixodes scapularis TaxID=6945 RepID=B7PLI1_IXOSC|nr:rwd domain-containing protein, putative [Ixodes scapularis]|eukprot:XP_002434629.1 rwd domain-containing protein, putative [Ixodes scapularis]